MNRLFKPLLITIAFLICTGGAWGASFSIVGGQAGYSADVTFNWNSNSLRNNGDSTTLWIDSSTAADWRIALIRFPALPDSAPANAVCDSARLILTQAGGNSVAAGEACSVSVTRCLRAWVEGNNKNVDANDVDDESCWRYWQTDENEWSTYGPQIGGADLASNRDTIYAIVGGGTHDANTADTFWLNPASVDSMFQVGSNNGWALQAQFTAGAGRAVEAWTDDYTVDETKRPRLDVWYQIVTGVTPTLTIGPPR